MARELQELLLGTAGTQVQDLFIYIQQGQQREMDELLWTRTEEQAAPKILFGQQHILNEKLEGRQGVGARSLEMLRMSKMNKDDVLEAQSHVKG